MRKTREERRAEVLKLLKEVRDNDELYISQAEISKKLRMSTADVGMHIRHLKQQGYIVKKSLSIRFQRKSWVPTEKAYRELEMLAALENAKPLSE